VANIINSDWLGNDFQVQYCYETVIRCVFVCVCVYVCVSGDTAVQIGGLVCSENS
jgi:hypothetical protein